MALCGSSLRYILMSVELNLISKTDSKQVKRSKLIAFKQFFRLTRRALWVQALCSQGNKCLKILRYIDIYILLQCTFEGKQICSFKEVCKNIVQCGWEFVYKWTADKMLDTA